MTMSMKGDRYISSPRMPIGKIHATCDHHKRKYSGLPAALSNRSYSDNSLYVGNDQDVHKSSGVEMTISTEGDPDISSPRNVKHEVHATMDPRTRKIVIQGPLESLICRLNPDNSLSKNCEMDIYKTSSQIILRYYGDEMTMSTDGDPDISSPRNLIHNLHVTHDSHTDKFVCLPASGIGPLNSDNFLSIRSEMDIYKSSGIKNLKYAEPDLYPRLSAMHAVHPRLDSATREITRTHLAWKEALLGATMEREIYARGPTRIGFPKPERMASRSCNNSKSAAGYMRADIDQTEAVYIHKQLAMLAESVGIIISPTVCGTGFRVGPNYVMTAKHVVDQIIKETIRRRQPNRWPGKFPR